MKPLQTHSVYSATSFPSQRCAVISARSVIVVKCSLYCC